MSLPDIIPFVMRRVNDHEASPHLEYGFRLVINLPLSIDKDY